MTNAFSKIPSNCPPPDRLRQPSPMLDVALRSVPRLENNGQDLLRRFPTEIRLMIFEELLVLQPKTIFRGAYAFGQLDKNEFEEEVSVPWQILQTCQRYHDEAAPILYGKNRIVFCTEAHGGAGILWRYPIGRRYMPFLTDLGIYIQADTPTKPAAKRISLFVRALARYTTRLEHLTVMFSSDRFYDATCPWYIVWCCNPIAQALDFLVGSQKIQHLKIRVHDGALLFPNWALALRQKFDQGDTDGRSITFTQSCSCSPNICCHHDDGDEVTDHCRECGCFTKNLDQKPIEKVIPAHYAEACEDIMMNLQYDLFHLGLLPPKDHSDDDIDEEEAENAGIYVTGRAATDDFEESYPAFYSLSPLPGQVIRYRSKLEKPDDWSFRQTRITEFFKVIDYETYIATIN